MQEKNVRSLMVLVTLLIFFPLWIALMNLFHFGLREWEVWTQTEISSWVKNLGSFVLLGAVLSVLTRQTSGWLNRRYPHAKPRSADWQDAD
jgi:uncharacterized protein involved in cysteine biosynthesis